jgi:recombination protein RecA
MAVDLGIVNKSGAWFTYDGEQLGQGRENAKNYLFEHPEVMVDITERVMVASGLRADESDEFSEADDQPIEID